MDRRQALRFLSALGITGPMALEALAQARRPVSPDILREASQLLDRDYDEERLRVIATALQRNLDQFQIVRDLEIDDLIEPAPLFRAEGK
jgi:hypothetical protein